MYATVARTTGGTIGAGRAATVASRGGRAEGGVNGGEVDRLLADAERLLARIERRLRAAPARRGAEAAPGDHPGLVSL